jgi:hypothetical protein
VIEISEIKNKGYGIGLELVEKWNFSIFFDQFQPIPTDFETCAFFWMKSLARFRKSIQN